MNEEAGTPARKGHVWLAMLACGWIVVLFAGVVVWQLAAGEVTLSDITFERMLPFLLAGFAAQFVDSAIGMGFGVISSGLLLSLGIPPQRSTAIVHGVESFGSGVSAISHIWLGNVDWGLFVRLVVPGVLGAIVGAALISWVPTQVARPVVFGYLAVIGAVLLYRALATGMREKRQTKAIGPLGFIGGVVDVAGGGGWGPVVGSTLLLRRAAPRDVVGTVNVSEFFVTVVATALLVGYFGVAVVGPAFLGLLIGAVVAAPFGAMLTSRLSPRVLLMAIGTVLIATGVAGMLL